MLAFPCNFPLSTEAIMMPGRLWQHSVDTETGGLQSRFSILCAWTIVILAGKRDSRRHSTTNLSGRELSFRSITSFNKNSRFNFSGEKIVKWSFMGVYFFKKKKKNFKSNLGLVGSYSSLVSNSLLNSKLSRIMQSKLRHLLVPLPSESSVSVHYSEGVKWSVHGLARWEQVLHHRNT